MMLIMKSGGVSIRIYGYYHVNDYLRGIVCESDVKVNNW